VQDAVDGQAVAGLKAPHRLLDVGIVDVVADRARIEIARHRQPRPQIGHARIVAAEPQFADQFADLGHHRPAAMGDDAVIGSDRGFGELRGGRRQRRRGRLRHLDGARRLVEILAEATVVGVADQRIERHVLGISARCGGARGRERRRTGQAAQHAAAVKPPRALHIVFIVRLAHGASVCKRIEAEPRTPATHKATPKNRVSTKRYGAKGRVRRFCRRARDNASKALQNRNARITLT
jgi:hypothetical protein